MRVRVISALGRPCGKLAIKMNRTMSMMVMNGEVQFLVTENQSTCILIGQVRCLENPGVIPLELIEVQSGSYLSKDDIVRLKDQYGRA